MAVRSRNSIDQLPEEIRAKVRSMLASKKPRHTYTEIIDEVHRMSGGDHAVSAAALSRYLHNVYADELDDAERNARFTVDLAKRVAQVHDIDNPADREALLISVIDGAILANQKGPNAVDPADLLAVRSAIADLDNKRRRIELAERKLFLTEQRKEEKIAALNDEIRRLKSEAASTSGSALAVKRKIFLAAGAQLLDILKTYADLRPLLTKYDRQIATRFATEAERFDFAEAANG